MPGPEKLSKVFSQPISIYKHYKVKLNISQQSSMQKLGMLIVEEITLEENLESLIEKDHQKDFMLATVTHDLKAPLNGMLAIVDLIQYANTLLEAKKHSNLIKQIGYWLNSMINDLLDYSRLKNNKLKLNIQQIDIVKVIDNIFAIIEPQTNHKSISLIKDINLKFKDRMIYTDPNRLSQVLLNFVSNSLK